MGLGYKCWFNGAGGAISLVVLRCNGHSVKWLYWLYFGVYGDGGVYAALIAGDDRELLFVSWVLL